MIQKLANLGTDRSELRDREPLIKRIRLVNILSLLAAAVGLVSLPFDVIAAPPWMIIEDIAAFLLFLLVPFANHAGRFRLSRMMFLLFGNAIMIINSSLMGEQSGMHLLFFSLAGFGVMLFDENERELLFLAVAIPVLSYFSVIEGGPYFIYSSLANFLFFCSSIFFLQRTNERSEAELKRSRVSAILSEKMAALGEMSSGMAHEINTPLTALHLNMDLLKRSLMEDARENPQIQTYVEKMEKMIARVTRITHSLQTFSRSAELDPLEPASLRSIVNDVLELCSERFRHSRVELRVREFPDSWQAECRPVQISQVFLNLLNNSYAAVIDLSERWVEIQIEKKGDWFIINVTDSGHGVALEHRDKIFQPFFTTKGPGKGTGLGLSVSKGIVESHGGRIYLATEWLHTRFVVELPISPALGRSSSKSP